MTPPAVAPPERLAAFRIALGVFVVVYLAIRLPVFLELGRRAPERFEPVGVFDVIGRPLDGWINHATLVVALVTGVGFAVGWRFIVTAPALAVALLLITSHRSSWGQLLHFENLMVLHVIVIAACGSAAADAWSVDARRQARADRPVHQATVRSGWPLQLAAIVTVTTYFVAGVAKLRYGGIEWITGDTLRHHIAYSATRLELLGGSPSPFAGWAVRNDAMLPPMAGASVAIELLAPLALLGPRLRNVWVAAAWLMHVGIYALMLVGFPSPLFLVAFAPMFPLERLVQPVLVRCRRWTGRRQPSQAGRLVS